MAPKAKNFKLKPLTERKCPLKGFENCVGRDCAFCSFSENEEICSVTAIGKEMFYMVEAMGGIPQQDEKIKIVDVGEGGEPVERMAYEPTPSVVGNKSPTREKH